MEWVVALPTHFQFDSQVCSFAFLWSCVRIEIRVGHLLYFELFVKAIIFSQFTFFKKVHQFTAVMTQRTRFLNIKSKMLKLRRPFVILAYGSWNCYLFYGVSDHQIKTDASEVNFEKHFSFDAIVSHKQEEMIFTDRRWRTLQRKQNCQEVKVKIWKKLVGAKNIRNICPWKQWLV